MYVDHVVHQTSGATDVANEIMSVITDTGSECSVLAVVCDGTTNNTGKNRGIVRQLEERLAKAAAMVNLFTSH